MLVLTSRSLVVNRLLKLDAYMVLGLSLVAFGVPIAAYFYWVVQSVFLTTFSLAMVVLGTSIIFIPENPVPTNAVKGIVEGVCANMESLLETFDASERAWYLPPREGRVFCFVPLVAGVKHEVVWTACNSPTRLMTAPMGIPGLMVSPPGSDILRLSRLNEDTELEDAMNYMLVDYLGVAKSVKAAKSGSKINILINKPKIKTDLSRFNKVLGSLPVSMLGCVVAQVLKTPVSVIEEKNEGNKIRAVVEILTRNV